MKEAVISCRADKVFLIICLILSSTLRLTRLPEASYLSASACSYFSDSLTWSNLSLTLALTSGKCKTFAPTLVL